MPKWLLYRIFKLIKMEFIKRQFLNSLNHCLRIRILLSITTSSRSVLLFVETRANRLRFHPSCFILERNLSWGSTPVKLKSSVSRNYLSNLFSSLWPDCESFVARKNCSSFLRCCSLFQSALILSCWLLLISLHSSEHRFLLLVLASTKSHWWRLSDISMDQTRNSHLLWLI